MRWNQWSFRRKWPACVSPIQLDWPPASTRTLRPSWHFQPLALALLRSVPSRHEPKLAMHSLACSGYQQMKR